MSGPPGVRARSPVARAGRAVAASVPRPPSPSSAPDPCVRTGPATTQPCAPVSAWFHLSNGSMTGGIREQERESDLEKARDT